MAGRRGEAGVGRSWRGEEKLVGERTSWRGGGEAGGGEEETLWGRGEAGGQRRRRTREEQDPEAEDTGRSAVRAKGGGGRASAAFAASRLRQRGGRFPAGQGRVGPHSRTPKRAPRARSGPPL